MSAFFTFEQPEHTTMLATACTRMCTARKETMHRELAYSPLLLEVLAMRRVTVPDGGTVKVFETVFFSLFISQSPEIIPHEPVPAVISASITAQKSIRHKTLMRQAPELGTCRPL